MAKKNTSELSKFANDFGFSGVDQGEVEIIGRNAVSEEMINTANQSQDYLQRLGEMFDAILPFLNNMKSAKGDYIHWPEKIRRAKIDEFTEKLNDIYRGNDD